MWFGIWIRGLTKFVSPIWRGWIRF